MEKDERFRQAIDDAVALAIPGEAGDYILGDFVAVAEVLVEDGGLGLAILAPEMTHAQVTLLSRAVDQAVQALFVSAVDARDIGGNDV
jgi:hypothetical protein